jgi:hypothetical protein
MKKAALFVFAGFLCVLYSLDSFAQINKIKEASGNRNFKTGTYLRLRHEYWKNIFDLETDAKDNRNYFRIKACLWGKLDFSEDISLFAKLTDEFKAYTYFYQSTSRKKRLHFDINETVFDNLYLDLNNFLDLPLDLRIGRQDFLGTYGEGFLIMEGTPLDGSRTFYFNALKATWHMDGKNSLDFVYINNPRDDIFLPVINEDKSPQRLNVTDEEAYLLYLKTRPAKHMYLENYYIYKREDDDSGSKLQAKKGIINTFGSFAKYDFSDYTLRGQLAYQFGDYGANDREGLGGYIFLDRSFKEYFWSPRASLGFVYLSGDDPSTNDNEGWDALFSRWPWVSELYSLTYNSESGIDYWTNLQMWRLKITLHPAKKAKLTMWYNFLRANENPLGSLFGTGKDRGHLPQLRLDYAFTKNIKAYILAEYFLPGDFHAASADDALFLRTEFSFKF